MLVKINRYIKNIVLDIFLNIIYIKLKIISYLSMVFKDDLYNTISTLRENKNIDYQFFSNKLKESHNKWKEIHKELKGTQKILHNISYNYWKRSFASRELKNQSFNKNTLFFLRSFLFLFYL